MRSSATNEELACTELGLRGPSFASNSSSGPSSFPSPCSSLYLLIIFEHGRLSRLSYVRLWNHASDPIPQSVPIIWCSKIGHTLTRFCAEMQPSHENRINRMSIWKNASRQGHCSDPLDLLVTAVWQSNFEASVLSCIQFDSMCCVVTTHWIDLNWTQNKTQVSTNENAENPPQAECVWEIGKKHGRSRE